MARHRYDSRDITEVTTDTLEKICPLTFAQDAIAGRWTVIVLPHLHKYEVIRLDELVRMIPGIS